MAPLTRSRAGPGNVPHALNALYYAQRASAGLIISEATQIVPEGQGYIATPGIHSAEQIEGWKCVTKAVHVAGGPIVLQLWHVGRISHPSFQPGGALPVAPSAIKPNAQAFTENGFEPIPTPRALETAEIPVIVEKYAQGARNAIAAGIRRRGGACRQRLSARSVSARPDQQADRSLWRQHRESYALPDRGPDDGRRRQCGGRGRTDRRPHLAAEHGERHRRQRSASSIQPRCGEVLQEKVSHISMSSRATPAARPSRPSTTSVSRTCSAGSSSSTTASTRRAPTRRSLRAAPISLHSASRSSPIRIS